MKTFENGYVQTINGSTCWMVGWLVWFYGISTYFGYLTPSPFLCKYSVLFQTIQFCSTLFNYQKYLYFKLFNLFKLF